MTIRNKVHKLIVYFEECLSLDLRSIALFRAALGALLLPYLMNLWSTLPAFYSDQGVVPRGVVDVLFPSHALFPLFFVSENPIYQSSLLLLIAVSAGCLLFGYRARLASAIAWYFLVSLFKRDPMTLNIGDILIALSLFWSIFLPKGRGARGSLSNRYFSMGVLALQVQIFVEYFAAGLAKLHPVWLKDGTAIYTALSIGMLGTDRSQLLKGLTLPWSRALGLLTILCELGLPLLLLIRMKKDLQRWIFIAVFLVFHVLIACFLNLNYAPWAPMVLLLALLPSSFWELVTRTRESAPSLTQERLPLPVEVILAALLVFIVTLQVYDSSSGLAPRPGLFWKVKRIESNLGLTQRWLLFAPKPNSKDAWVDVEGRLRDGRVVDLFRNGEKPLLEVKDVRKTYPDPNWVRYFNNLRKYGRPPYYQALARYLCQGWNEKHAQAEVAEHVVIKYRYRLILPPGEPETPIEEDLWYDGSCS